MNEALIESMVRVGTVSSVRGRTARVYFPDMDMVSGDLYILKSPPGLSDEEITVAPWLPAVGDVVVCLYIPVFGGDGFILGGI